MQAPDRAQRRSAQESRQRLALLMSLVRRREADAPRNLVLDQEQWKPARAEQLGSVYAAILQGLM
jgi:hypothetical protein